MDGAAVNTNVPNNVQSVQNRPQAGGVGAPSVVIPDGYIENCKVRIDQSNTPDAFRSTVRKIAAGPTPAPTSETPTIQRNVIQEGARQIGAAASAQVTAAVSQNPNMAALDLLDAIKDGLDPETAALITQAQEEQAILAGEAHA